MIGRILAGSLAALLAVQGASAQDATGRFYSLKGQIVSPAYEGWFPNEDGTFTLYFGYFNSNWEEEFDLPVGPGQRGVANLCAESGARTCGALYLITPADAVHLDRTEGVHRGYYERIAVTVALDGTLDGTVVTCGCHGAQFDLRTGDVLAPPATEPVKTYALRVENGNVIVEV